MKVRFKKNDRLQCIRIAVDRFLQINAFTYPFLKYAFVPDRSFLLEGSTKYLENFGNYFLKDTNIYTFM